jgi:glycolate oxidase FAD binding subunit
MSDTLKPENAEQLLQAVQWAVAEKQPLEVLAGGSKRAYGRPMQTAATLDLSALYGIKIYEPAELYMTALAGTPMSDIDAALAEAGQQLSFEPPDLGPLLGGAANAGTIGGVVACRGASKKVRPVITCSASMRCRVAARRLNPVVRWSRMSAVLIFQSCWRAPWGRWR